MTSSKIAKVDLENICRMDVTEFQSLGFLQEVNRLFFHPRGLALEVVKGVDGEIEGLGGIWDYREDPEGIIFNDGTIDQTKVVRVEDERLKHIEARVELFGSEIQKS